MKWILIIYIQSTNFGTALNTIDFAYQINCETAAKHMREQKRILTAKCFRK